MSLHRKLRTRIEDVIFPGKYRGKTEYDCPFFVLL